MIHSKLTDPLLVPLVAIVMSICTWAVGWWTIPLVAFLAGAALHRTSGRSGALAGAAALAWLALLFIDFASSRFGPLTRVLGGVLGVPGLVVIIVTLLFAAGLAWSAGTLGAALRGTTRRTRAVAA